MALTANSGKKYKAAVGAYDREALYSPLEAAEIVKKIATAKFDESVEVAVRLGVDPRKADQMIRGTVALPSGTGKTVRIAVFAQGEAAQAAREAGADLVGADDEGAAVGDDRVVDDDAGRTYDLAPGRSAWVHVARGTVSVNGRPLAEGDAAAVTDASITLSAGSGAEVLVFDLA